MLCIITMRYKYHCVIVDGGWSIWSDWNTCSVTCGGGEQHRHRYCTNPTPKFGGENCTGHSVEDKECNDNPCPGK